jgi:uncharacterized repeat protein (TIGR03803 family)
MMSPRIVALAAIRARPFEIKIAVNCARAAMIVGREERQLGGYSMQTGPRLRTLYLAGIFALLATPLSAAIDPRGGAAPPSTEQVLYKFCSQSNCVDGGGPGAGLLMDGSGNLYGTTQSGGTKGYGTVFQLTLTSTGWTEKVLYSFCSQSNCADGANPKAGLIMDAAGNLYGTTVSGSATSGGVVFQLTPTATGWSENVLYSFCSQSNCADGYAPRAGLIMDGAGNLYGTTYGGGQSGCFSGIGCGVVFQLTPSGTGWSEKVLYTFCSQSNCADGSTPLAALIMDAAGNLYGTTWTGGGIDDGVVFELTPSGTGWSQKILYSFCSLGGSSCKDGARPQAGLIMDAAGNLYGTTQLGGGVSYLGGTVFQLTQTGTGWSEKVLYTFCSQTNCVDGEQPVAGLIMDAAGNLYGTTYGGGAYGTYRHGDTSRGYGGIFQLTPSGTGWSEKVLYNFCSQSACTDGAHPEAGLIMDGAGNLYGTTFNGGTSGNGLVFALNLETNAYTLSVSKTGSGTVTSSPSGIDCGSTCSASFDAGTQVTLTASAASGSTFGGWSGACSGTGTCTLMMNSNQSVTAAFSLGTYSLSVSAIGSPGGKVTSSPSGINCGSTCSANFSAGTQVTLTASPAYTWGFFGWGGACRGLASCTVTMSANTSASATFSALFSVEAVAVVTSNPDVPGLLPVAISPIPQ